MIAAAPAAARNAPPILAVLRRELPRPCRLLEIGSGSGQHAAHFSAAIPGVEWHPSELPEKAWALRLSLARSDELLAQRAIEFDVEYPLDSLECYDAVYSCNTAHIMPLASVQQMFRRVDELTNQRGRFFLYGPFRLDGGFTSQSNATFHEGLRIKDPAMGIRRLETLDEFAARHNFERVRLYSMPSNNFLAIWARRGARE